MTSSNKVILITGASRGIGAATALQAARAGYAVGVNYLNNQTAAQNIAQEIHVAGGRALLLQGDVGKEQDVQQMFQTLVDAFGPLTALVNNAGILEQQAPATQIDSARLNRVLTTNVIGSFLCAQAAIQHMSTRFNGSGGAIVNVSSRAAVLGSPNEFIDYAMSKGAIDTMTIGLAKEVAAEGIRVNAVRPGLIETDIHAASGEPERVARLSANIPMGRGGTTEEVASSILWLLSDEASYITGSLLDIAGGR